SERVAEIVPAKIGNLSFLETLFEPTLPIAPLSLIGASANIGRTFAAEGEDSESLFRDGIDRDVASGTMFALRNSDDPRTKVHVLPAQFPLFISAHSSVQGQVKFRFSRWVQCPDFGTQGLFFFGLQEPCAQIVFPFSGYVPNRILSYFPIS